jgi:plasmid maintenance system antidote protein VapI
MGMIDSIRVSKTVDEANEYLLALKNKYDYASDKTIRRAERAVILRDRELNAPVKKTKKKK